MNQKFSFLIKVLCFFFIIGTPMLSVKALTYPEPSQQDVQAFNQILNPLWKVISFVQYAGSVAALFYILITAVGMVMKSDEAESREKGKKTIGVIIAAVGLVWAAPYIINYMVT